MITDTRLSVKGTQYAIFAYVFHHVALQCEHTFFSPPRGASDHPLVFFSIAAVTVALGVRVADMTSSGSRGSG